MELRDEQTDAPGQSATLSPAVLQRLPERGAWSVESYLTTFDRGGVEFVEGTLEPLPLPGNGHQLLVRVLFQMRLDYLAIERICLGPSRLRIDSDRFREPDLFVLPFDASRSADAKALAATYHDAAEFCLEVVSEGNLPRERDYHQKPADYAVVGVREYWVVDPFERAVAVWRRDASGELIASGTARGDTPV